MQKRVKGSIADTRWLDLQQACIYTGLGKDTFRKWAKENGCEVKIGRLVRYDKQAIDAAMDKAKQPQGA